MSLIMHETSDTNVSLDEIMKTKPFTEVRNEHENEAWTDDESTSSTSSSDSDFFSQETYKTPIPTIKPAKTKGELDIEDLPPIEELTISVQKEELMKIGKIHGIVSKQVIIQATNEQKALDIDSILFLASDKPLGRVFDVFGPVVEPFYVVLFNSPEDIVNKGITIGEDVYFAPEKRDITKYVFVDVLRQQKGSDASWNDNNEPPEEFLDYSDDEQERSAKQKRNQKKHAHDNNVDNDIQILSESRVDKSKRASDFQNKRNYSQKKFHAKRPSYQRTYGSTESKNLDNVQVWITSPPSSLITSDSLQQRLPSVQMRQPFLHPKQPYIPRQPPITIRPAVFQPQPFIPPPRNYNYVQPSHFPNVNHTPLVASNIMSSNIHMNNMPFNNEIHTSLQQNRGQLQLFSNSQISTNNQTPNTRFSPSPGYALPAPTPALGFTTSIGGIQSPRQPIRPPFYFAERF